MKSEGKIKEVGHRLEFVIMISIFFPSLMTTLYGLSGVSSEETGKAVLNYSIFIAFLLVDYLVFHFSKDELKSVAIKITNFLLYLIIISFLVLICLFGVFKNDPIKEPVISILKYTIWVIPISSALILATFIPWGEVVEFYELVKEQIKRLKEKQKNKNS